MNRRFVWNFEINTDNSLQIPCQSLNEPCDMVWESRFFWHENEIITLDGLSDNFLDLSHYQIKHKADEYYLLPNLPYNLKIRRNCLYYKPLITKMPLSIAYGKKINLHEHSPTEILPCTENLNTDTLLTQIHNKSRRILVEKEVLRYQFKVTLKTQLELARLKFSNATYFSACIESPSRGLVESIAMQLFKKESTRDYVSFLQQTLV